jgi:hypothetical protein
MSGVSENEFIETARPYHVRKGPLGFNQMVQTMPLYCDLDDKDAGYSLAYPKSFTGAVGELQHRGLDCPRSLLMKLVEDRVVIPRGRGDNQEWSEEDIDEAAEWLRAYGHLNAWGHFCEVANVEFGQAVKAYRDAVSRYGLMENVTFEPLGVTVVVKPASDAITGYATVEFYPAGASVAVNLL